MIESCKDYINNRGTQTIWSQNRREMKEKLLHCIQLNATYQKTYRIVKAQELMPDQVPFNFSENYVFGKFNGFCERLKKIISMFDVIDDYTGLFERRMEGLLLGDSLEDAIKKFNEIKDIIMKKTYDYLDQKNTAFDVDYSAFRHQVEALIKQLAAIIEASFDSVWETPQGIKFLVRFEKVAAKIPICKMEEKYSRILKHAEKEVEKIIKMYKKQKDDPPIPMMFPPIAGRIKWARSLICHLDELMESITGHEVLKTLPATNDLSKRHRTADHLLRNYQDDIIAVWMNQHVSDVDKCLKRKLLTICSEKNKLKVNQHITIPLLIRESDLMLKMDLPVPVICFTLYNKREHFGFTHDSLQFLIKDFIRAVQSVKPEVRPLFLPHLDKLIKIIEPGLIELDWVSHQIRDYIQDANEAVERFQILVDRVNDVYTNRILEVLKKMQEVTLLELPEKGTTWTVEEFNDKIETICRTAATELHNKSMMVERAVEEILTLVKQAKLVNADSSTEEFFTEGIKINVLMFLN